MHGNVIKIRKDATITIEHVGRERSKVILHWVPPTLHRKWVEEMVMFLTDEKIEAYRHKDSRLHTETKNLYPTLSYIRI
jgi:hypothetical protein